MPKLDNPCFPFSLTSSCKSEWWKFFVYSESFYHGDGSIRSATSFDRYDNETFVYVVASPEAVGLISATRGKFIASMFSL